jgi:O-antigen ligase
LLFSLLGAIIFVRLNPAYYLILPTLLIFLILFFLGPKWIIFFVALFRVNLDSLRLINPSDYELQLVRSLNLDGVVSLLTIICLAVYLLHKKKVFVSSLAMLYSLFLGLCIISLIYSLDVLSGLRQLIHYGNYLVIYLFTVNVIEDKEDNRRLILFLLFSSLIPLVAGFLQFFTLGGIQEGGVRRIYATAENPIRFGIYLVVMFNFTLALLLSLRSYKQKVTLSLLCLCLIFSLFQTFSRAGWVSLLIALFIFIVLSPKGKYWKLLILFIYICALIVAVFLLPQIWLRILAFKDIAWRIFLWSEELPLFLERPLFGYGLGSTTYVISKAIMGFPILIHNDYLRILLELGVVGLLIYLSVLISIVVWGFKVYLRNKDSREIYLAIGIISSMVCFLFQSFFSNVFDADSQITYLVFFLCAIGKML